MGDNYQDQKDLFFVVTSFYQNMLLLFNCYLALYLSKIRLEVGFKELKIRIYLTLFVLRFLINFFRQTMTLPP